MYARPTWFPISVSVGKFVPMTIEKENMQMCVSPHTNRCNVHSETKFHVNDCNIFENNCTMRPRMRNRASKSTNFNPTMWFSSVRRHDVLLFADRDAGFSWNQRHFCVPNRTAAIASRYRNQAHPWRYSKTHRYFLVSCLPRRHYTRLDTLAPPWFLHKRFLRYYTTLGDAWVCWNVPRRMRKVTPCEHERAACQFSIPTIW